MRRFVIIFAFGALLFSCGGDPAPAQQQPDEPPTAIYHIRAEDLPEPFATPSAGNPPIVVPTMNIDRLNMPRGFRVGLWTEGFSRPRQAYVASNGDVLVVESGADRVTLLRDVDENGTPEFRQAFMGGLNRPFGIDANGGFLYIGNTDSVVRVPYQAGQERSDGAPEVVVPNIPTGGHWTRDVAFSPDGSKMYVSIGSRSNVDEEGPPRAAVMEYNPDGAGERVYGFGIRNPVGLRFQPATGKLWVAVNERDGLGDDLPPDYVTSIRDGGFYGWPYAYIGSNPEPRLDGKRPDLVEQAIVPDVLIQAHSAALGLLFYTGEMFPEEYRGELFVALHGSWNRDRRTGYKVIRVHMDSNGDALGTYEDFVAGWSVDPESKEVWGRPVGLAQLSDGSMIVLEDGGHKIWRVTYDSSLTSVTPEGKLPAKWADVKTLAVLPAFPNPANPEVWVPYVLGVHARTRLSVYDAKGEVVRDLDLGGKSAGDYTPKTRAAHWDGRNEKGETVAGGVYFVQLRTESVRSRLQRVLIAR